MNVRRSIALVTLPALAFAGFVFAEAPRPGKNPPGKNANAGREQIAAAIKKNGRLPKASYWSNAEILRGVKARKIAAAPLHAKGAGQSAALAASTKSALTVVGGEGLPPGFGSGFHWDRAEQEALLVLFINAADPMGVSIDGLEAGDQVQVMSASGIASFARDRGNPLASSIVGLVATGAKIVVTAEGIPEAVPAITAAEKFAKDQFKATNAKTKRRDAFGLDPSSGHKAREEGGLLVCLPEGGGTYYSGDDSHRDRWIKGNGVRTDDHLPSHIYGSFFPRQGEPVHNTRTVRQSGQMFVLAWDWKFEDNAGFYKVFLKLRRGNGLSEPIPRTK
jgi:hypothetical protein